MHRLSHALLPQVAQGTALSMLAHAALATVSSKIRSTPASDAGKGRVQGIPREIDKRYVGPYFPPHQALATTAGTLALPASPDLLQRMSETGQFVASESTAPPHRRSHQSTRHSNLTPDVISTSRCPSAQLIQHPSNIPQPPPACRRRTIYHISSLDSAASTAPIPPFQRRRHGLAQPATRSSPSPYLFASPTQLALRTHARFGAAPAGIVDEPGGTAPPVTRHCVDVGWG